MKKDALAGVEDFVKQHYVESTVWPEGTLDNWLKWSAAHGYLMVAMDDSKAPVGLIIARVVKEIPKRGDLQPYDEDGDICYVDFAIAPNKKILRALGWALLQRYGNRKFLAYRNNAHTNDDGPDHLRKLETAKLISAYLKLRN